ncbi:hypothetical protein ColTof4_09547 [Colletotrichum tofieldiae]|nr:hypothetical protein ColTof3_04896 [Colletotrichum tofieldiae]GKT77124.1 hypothetical protein ColTof4_09547 [Colletotrichum tofieldiae]
MSSLNTGNAISFMHGDLLYPATLQKEVLLGGYHPWRMWMSAEVEAAPSVQFHLRKLGLIPVTVVECGRSWSILRKPGQNQTNTDT